MNISVRAVWDMDSVAQVFAKLISRRDSSKWSGNNGPPSATEEKKQPAKRMKHFQSDFAVVGALKELKLPA